MSKLASVDPSNMSQYQDIQRVQYQYESAVRIYAPEITEPAQVAAVLELAKQLWGDHLVDKLISTDEKHYRIERVTPASFAMMAVVVDSEATSDIRHDAHGTLEIKDHYLCDMSHTVVLRRVA